MKSIKLNGVKHYIPQLSELSFREFDRVIIQEEVTELKQYIALFADTSLEDLMKSELTGANLPSLHNHIFNLDVEQVIKDKKETVLINGETRSMSSLSHSTFGTNYNFDLYLGSYKRKKITFYSLCLYALAISVSGNDMEEIGKTYEELSKQKWTKVLPQGFFLAKKFSTSKVSLIRLWATCTLQSKGIKWKMKISRKKLIIQERI